jgi:hypothetical protein
MTTERGTAGPLHAGWRMAKVGLWIGLFVLAGEGVGALLFGDAADWWGKLIAVPVWIVAFAVGGVLYSLFLPASVRARPGPATGARMRTGALAGAMTGGLAATPVMLVTPASGQLALGALVVLILLAITTLIGAACGYAASLEARPGGGAGTGGLGASPRLADRP